MTPRSTQKAGFTEDIESKKAILKTLEFNEKRSLPC
jgi:hypothetical protein